MTEAMAALIAEAQRLLRSYASVRQFAVGGEDIGDERAWQVADALESLTASLSVSERSDATVTEVTAPATDDERRALALAIDPNALELDAYPWPLDAADRAIAAGFHRSSRVPVSRDELAENLRRIHFDGTGCGTTASTACSNCFGPSPMTAREIAEHLSTTYDIYPKAARKPADSGEAHA